MKFVVDLDDTLVSSTQLNNDAYNFALEEFGYNRIITDKRITRERLGEYNDIDKIISFTFNNINHPIFVCQKDIIINNSETYNCCDSNFKSYECIFPTDSIIPPTTDNSKTDNISPINNNKSSSSISTGAIIGIIAASIGVVIFVIIIIICYKREPSPEKNPQNTTTISNMNTSVFIQNNN